MGTKIRRVRERIDAIRTGGGHHALRVFDTTCDLRVFDTTCDLRVFDTTKHENIFSHVFQRTSAIMPRLWDTTCSACGTRHAPRVGHDMLRVWDTTNALHTQSSGHSL